jgi:hypothetical protein
MLAFVVGVGVAGLFVADEAAAQTRPALVKDADNPARSPLRLGDTATVPVGFVASFGNSVGSVLADGYRFVIEYVSVECGASGAVEAVRVYLSIAEKAGPGWYRFHTYPIPLTNTAPTYDGRVSSVGTQSVRWYHDGGQAVQVGISLNGAAPSGGITCEVEVSGYTVTVP